MAWKCAVCGEVDGRNKADVKAVCHHCGKPLCSQHQVVILDPDFGHEADDPLVWAIHCKACGRKHHWLAPRQRKGRKP